MSLSQPLLEQETIINDKIYQICLILSLPFVILLSNTGMILLKHGERTEHLSILITGYALEGLAFALYPISMRTYPLRVITVCWAGGSTLTAIASGWMIFNEIPNTFSIFGCCVVVLGMIIVCIDGIL